MDSLINYEPKFTLTDDTDRKCKEITSKRTTCNQPSVFMVRYVFPIDPAYYSEPFECATEYFCLEHFEDAKKCVLNEWSSYLRNVQEELINAYYTLRTLVPALTHPMFKDLP